MAKFNPKDDFIPDTIVAAPYRGAEPIEMRKIDVILYGDGKSKKNFSDIIYCACPEKCSLYALGKCMQHRKLLNATDLCHFGGVMTKTGYTRRAASFYDFNSYIKSDPLYSQTKGDISFALVKISDTFALKLLGIEIVRDENAGHWKVSMDSLGGSVAWIPEDELTVELLKKIASAQPRNIFGNVITSYKTEAIPRLLENLHKVAPDLHDKFIAAYPEYASCVRDNVGRFAYVATLAEGAVLRFSGNTWTMHDGKLVGDNIRIDKGFSPLGRADHVELEVDEKATIKVESNDWCDEDTVFTTM